MEDKNKPRITEWRIWILALSISCLITTIQHCETHWKMWKEIERTSALEEKKTHLLEEQKRALERQKQALERQKQALERQKQVLEQLNQSLKGNCK